MIIDTHCHIYASEMENAEEIIMEAADNDIHMVLNGTDPSSNREVLELSDKYDNVHAALGYFYTLADEITDEEIELLDRQLGSDNVVAVGEIGLDYYHTKDNRDKQIELFENMLILAEKHDVVGSLHSYQGSAEMAQQFIRLGFYIGVGGTITHKNNKKARRMLENTDINHLLLETDSPYLSPQEKMGEMNTPLNIRYVVRKLAEELDMEKSEVIEITTENARNLFTI